jgi:hypothetical protein
MSGSCSARCTSQTPAMVCSFAGIGWRVRAPPGHGRSSAFANLPATPERFSVAQATARESAVLTRFSQEGLVSQQGGSVGGPWFFTALGISRVVRSSQMSAPKPVFEVRPLLAVADLTCYELLVMLDKDGWVWKPWVPPKARRKREENAFLPYRRGSPKVWYTAKTFSKVYAAVLLDSEALFDQGLPEIPHGSSDVVYKRIQHGNFALHTLPIAAGALNPDIEDVPAPLVPRLANRAAAAAAVPAAAGLADPGESECDADHGDDGGQRGD